MPISPMQFCTEQHCYNFTPSGKCLEHKRAVRRAEASKRTSTHKRGYDKKWQDFRLQYLKQHPLCECDLCMSKPQWARQTATEVDHIDGQGPKGVRGYDPTNLKAMSKSHHSRKTYYQDGSFGKPKTDKYGV